MRPRRRNGDERLRELTRRVAAGEHDLIPVLAREWERAGGSSEPALSGPLSIQQIRDRTSVGGGTVRGVVSVNLGEVIDADTESFLDMLSERLTGYASLSGTEYTVIGLGKYEDDLLIEVRGDPSLILEIATPPNCSACGNALDEGLDRHEADDSWEDQCRACRIGPEPELARTCASCDRDIERSPHGWIVPAQAAPLVCGGPDNRGRGRHTPARLPAGVESGPMCNCAHVQSLHQDGTGRCLGTGADIDPEYEIPPEEWCACRSFDPSD